MFSKIISFIEPPNTKTTPTIIRFGGKLHHNKGQCLVRMQPNEIIFYTPPMLHPHHAPNNQCLAPNNQCLAPNNQCLAPSMPRSKKSLPRARQ